MFSDLYSASAGDEFALSGDYALYPNVADFLNRFPGGVAGRFYVDDSCIYCALCVQTAPTVFHHEAELGWAVVFQQPTTEEELNLAYEAMQACPLGSIGCDGDRYDWEGVPSRWGRSLPKDDCSSAPLDQKWRFSNRSARIDRCVVTMVLFLVLLALLIGAAPPRPAPLKIFSIVTLLPQLRILARCVALTRSGKNPARYFLANEFLVAICGSATAALHAVLCSLA